MDINSICEFTKHFILLPLGERKNIDVILTSSFSSKNAEHM